MSGRRVARAAAAAWQTHQPPRRTFFSLLRNIADVWKANSDLKAAEKELVDELQPSRMAERERTIREKVRAFRADAAKAPAPSVVVAPRVKNKVDEGPAPVLKRRRVDAPAPAPAPAPLSGLVAYGSSDSDSDDS